MDLITLGGEFMVKNSVIILQDNEKTISLMKNVIESIDNLKVVGSSIDGEEGLSLIKKHEPELLVLGIILKNKDGFEVLEKLKSLGLETKVIVVSSFTREDIIQSALSLGAHYYIAKPYNDETLIKRIKESLSEKPVEQTIVKPEIKRSSLDEKISKIFITVGIPPHIKGYYYLREGVKMAVNNPDIINNVTKQLYPKIGELFSTSASKVERAIRHAIEVAWNKGRIESLNSILGIRAYMGNEKPTNSEFIALIADKMLLEGA